MNYYLDTEFSEGMRKSISWLPAIGSFNKIKWGIELISIGIKCSDGRTYYAVSEEFNPDNCNEWVKANVLPKLPKKYIYEFEQDAEELFPNRNLEIEKKNPVYKSLEVIKDDVALFFGCGIGDNGNYQAPEGIEVYGYYADYDWVVLCSLFKAMVNLPKGFPFYCRDLKQSLDELAMDTPLDDLLNGAKCLPTKKETMLRILTNPSLEEKLSVLKDHHSYPKQTNEHNALSDAEFNEKLHIFISSFKK